MKVIYTGAGSHRFHSAPSGTDYVFFSGVSQEVRPEDEDFFRRKASNPNNPWRVEGIVEVVAKTTADVVVDAVEKAANKLTGKGKKKGVYKGDDE